MRKLDLIDKKIIALLQDNANTPLTKIAKTVNLSTTPCWHRIQKLKAEGVLLKNVTLVNQELVNANVIVFVSIKIGQHNVPWLKTFTKAVISLPQVVEYYRMSGEVDLLLRLVVADIKSYDDIYHQIMSLARVHNNQTGTFDVSSSFALERVKYTTAIPLDYV
jgi:Lrp/AsnC family transcriptional regulator